MTFPLGPFVPASCNPIMTPGTAPHESGNVYNPAAVVRDDIGAAISEPSGRYWQQQEQEPILIPPGRPL